MKFYKLKKNDKEVFVNLEQILLSTDVVKDYAAITGLIPADEENWEVVMAPLSEYCEHLIQEVYKVFRDELESIKQSWTHKSPDEICSMCYRAVYISDVMNVLENADVADFNFEVLEKWLKNPKKLIDVICDRIINRSCSDYNESICDYINQGLEA